jgi:integrase
VAKNLVKKGSTWHVRLAIPKDVQHAFGFRKILTRSLKTSDSRKAELLSASFLLEWKALIDETREGSPLPNDWSDQIMEVVNRVNDDIHQHALSLVGQGTYVNGSESDTVDPAWLDHPELIELLAYLNSDQLTMEQKVEYRQELGRLFKEAAPRLFEKKYIDRSPSENDLLASAKESPDKFTAKHPITKDIIEKWNNYLNTQLDNKKTIASHTSRIRKIAKFLSSKELDLNFDSIHIFINESKAAQKTIKNYLWSGRDLWEWANIYNESFKKRHIGKANPFNGHRLPKNKDAKAKSWEVFTQKEVELLHKKAKAAGKTELSNLIEIAAYTGMRLEEIGRIQPSDITYKNNTPYSIQVTKAKTKSGIREIPIHLNLSCLILELCANPKDGYLLQGRQNKYDLRLDYLSKQFGKLKKAAGFSKNHVFHSIRKTTATELQHSGADILIIPAILGHETGTITYDIYAQGPSMKQKHEAISRLNFDFSI